MTDREIKLVVLDFDGVISDGYLYLNEQGQETKRISFRDVMGISRARRKGLKIAVISGESSLVLDRYIERFGLDMVVQGCSDKLAALQKLISDMGISPSEVGYMGDDINDLEPMKLSGFSAAPRNAHSSAIEVADFVSLSDGGVGAVREFLEFLEVL